MNKRELTKAKRLLRDIASYCDVFRFEYTARGRKILSYGISVKFRSGATRLYHSLDTVEHEISYQVMCDSVNNMGFEHSYFPSRIDAKNAIRDVELLLNRKLDYLITPVACIANTDYKIWNESGCN